MKNKMNKQFAILIMSLALLTSGCVTWQHSAGKILASTALTVDAAMKSWAIYVVTNHPSAVKEASVKDAYGKYQLAMKAASDAYGVAATAKDQSPWLVARDALNVASTTLTALITAFQKVGVR